MGLTTSGLTYRRFNIYDELSLYTVCVVLVTYVFPGCDTIQLSRFLTYKQPVATDVGWFHHTDVGIK